MDYEHYRAVDVDLEREIGIRILYFLRREPLLNEPGLYSILGIPDSISQDSGKITFGRVLMVKIIAFRSEQPCSKSEHGIHPIYALKEVKLIEFE